MKIKNSRFPIEIKIPQCYLSYPEDCKRLVELCKRNGIEISLKEADFIWSDISDKKYAAGWMNVFSMDEETIMYDIYCFIKESIFEELSKHILDFEEDYDDI